MRLFIFCVFLCLRAGESKLWSKGIVHYAISNKDYDPHSQDVIVSTFERIEREICVKFFNTPLSTNGSDHKILYISNPDKRKNCPPEHYDFEKGVVDMPVGYKCLTQRDITRVVVDMLRASIKQPMKPNSNDLVRKFQEQAEDPNSSTLLAAHDRNFINAHYHRECGDLVAAPVETRRLNNEAMEVSLDNEQFYRKKLWPLGIVMYSVSEDVEETAELELLQRAMSEIESNSCVVFQLITDDDALQPKNKLVFGDEGDTIPPLGYTGHTKNLNVETMTLGAPGHVGHTLNIVMRILGIPMMSNRFDRDNYVTVNWKNVEKTKEHLLERLPKEAWVRNADGEGSAYDFDSVTHAPVNFMCKNCSLGEQTVTPNEDHLWQRSLTMGHRKDLSSGDIDLLNILYSNECQRRILSVAK